MIRPSTSKPLVHCCKQFQWPGSCGVLYTPPMKSAWKLTYPLKIHGWKMKWPFKMVPFFRGHVNFSEGKPNEALLQIQILSHSSKSIQIASSKFSHRRCQWESLKPLSLVHFLFWGPSWKKQSQVISRYLRRYFFHASWVERRTSSKFMQVPPITTSPRHPPPTQTPPLRTTSNDRGKCTASLFRNLAFIRCVHAACEECYTSTLSMETHYWNWKLNMSKTMPTTSKVPPANMFVNLQKCFTQIKAQ